MKKSFVLIIVLTLALCVYEAKGQSTSVFSENAWGVYSWTQFTAIDKNTAPLAKGGPIIMRWTNVEPQNGVFKFDTELLPKLQRAAENNWYVFLKIYLAAPSTSGFTPEWLYSNGVPKVSAGGNFPYYFDEDYKGYYYRLIAEFGKYVLALPDNLKSRILFIQSTEGTTGDGGYYKSDPAGTEYDITRDQWSEFRLAAWKEFKTAFSKDGVLQFPILTNNDANTDFLKTWMLTELPNAIGVKNGMFTHGYQISDAQERLKAHLTLKAETEAAGKVFFARGEMDAEMNEKGWITQNKKQGIYWSAIYATHCAISMWNFPQDDLKGNTYADGINFFNKYAGEVNPKSAKGAFCAFYRGLDASDVNEFPVTPFGTASKSNQQRYVNICNDYKAYGAGMADAAAATGGGMVNRDASGYNDAGWQILTTNFQRHITQIEAETTSDAWWQVDATVYGRFARGFNPSVPEKNAMYFNLDEQFLGNQPLVGSQSLDVSITYLDSDPGSWELLYDAADGTMKSAMSITNTGTGSGVWKTKTVNISDAYLRNRGSKGADFMLVNKGSTNCRFHMIAVDKVGFETGISNIPQNNNLKDLVDIYPNPVNDLLHFNFKDNSSNKLISIINNMGQKIFNTSTKDNNFQLNVMALKYRGLAIIKTETDHSVSIKKIIVD